jgi:hypothetical protein
MGNEECPLCSADMEVRNVAPCEECGGDPESLDRFGAKNQTYHLVRVLGGRELVLCTGCMLDFGSLDPNFLGVPAGAHYGFENMEIVREINAAAIRADNYCPECEYRLKFLRFVKDVRSTAQG